MRQRINHFLILFFLISIISSTPPSVDGLNEEANVLKNVTRSQFPKDFIFGASTSSYQIEGAYLEAGRSLSNWDAFCRVPGKVANGDNGFIADDSYHHYLKDIEILHSMGVDAYRFSISWSRILPRGRFGEVNPSGIIFYNKIINTLLQKGIKPFVTIFHFEYPQELEDRYGAWLSPQMQEDFVHFAKTCFQYFGRRVKHWMTINEPNIFAQMAYGKGKFPPARCSPHFGNCTAGSSNVEPLLVMHNMLLAHGKAVKLYRQLFQPKQGGSVGIVVHGFMYEPLNNDKHQVDAAKRALAFNIAWVLDPVIFGDYPLEMHRYHGTDLPKFTSKEKTLMKDSIDFIGLNHYGTLYAKDCIYSLCPCNTSMYPGCVPNIDTASQGFTVTVSERDGVPIGEPTGMSQFFVVPRGMEEIVDYLKNRYHNKPIFITENGYSSLYNQVQIEEIKNDVKRTEYHKAYLAYLARAMRHGADIRGYFIWSLMDSFEWQSGYDIKFGLYYVDHQTLNRIPKSSALWYQDFLGKNNVKSVLNKDALDLYQS